MEDKRKADINILELGINNSLRWRGIKNIKVILERLGENKIGFDITKIEDIPDSVFSTIIGYDYHISGVEVVDKHGDKRCLGSLGVISVLDTRQEYKEIKLILSYI
jgi:hypothetical protein